MIPKLSANSFNLKSTKQNDSFVEYDSDLLLDELTFSNNESEEGLKLDLEDTLDENDFESEELEDLDDSDFGLVEDDDDWEDGTDFEETSQDDDDWEFDDSSEEVVEESNFEENFDYSDEEPIQTDIINEDVEESKIDDKENKKEKVIKKNFVPKISILKNEKIKKIFLVVLGTVVFLSLLFFASSLIFQDKKPKTKIKDDKLEKIIPSEYLNNSIVDRVNIISLDEVEVVLKENVEGSLQIISFSDEYGIILCVLPNHDYKENESVTLKPNFYNLEDIEDFDFETLEILTTNFIEN